MKKLSTSILIVGSGGAGLRLAIELFRKGQKNILVVGDCEFREAHTTMAEGGVNAPFSNMPDEHDSPTVHWLDTFVEGHNIGDPRMIEQLTFNACEAIDDLVDMGADFHREPDGKISQRYFGAHTYRRTVFKGDHTGQEMLRVLCDQVDKLKIPHVDKLYVAKLLVKDNQVYGVVGVDDKDELTTIEAPVVVLATGGHSNIYRRSSSREWENYGEGTAMAMREGARIGDMEMIQFHPTGLVFPEDVAGELVTEAVRGEGGVLTNTKGERFMKRYSPDKMELATRDVVARANYMEIMAGRGTDKGAVYLDIASVRPAEYILERLPKMHRQLLKWNNVDITKEKMEVAPTAHYAMGGIKVSSEDCQTDINGLYAIGESTVGVHGANRLGGNSLAEIIVFGKLLGQKLADKKLTAKAVPAGMVEDFEKYVEGKLLADGELDAEEMCLKARNIMWEHAGIARTEENLDAGIEEIAELKAMVADKGLKKGNSKMANIINAMRLQAILELGETVLRGAKERKESRGAHYREDYPQKSDDYRKNFFFTIKNGQLTMTDEPIPEPRSSLKKALADFEKTHNYGHVE